VISVVIETYTLMHEYASVSPAELPLVRVLAALCAQSVAREQLEIIVVVDTQSVALADFLRTAWPDVHVAPMPDGRYFTMKNHGLGLAHGEYLGFLDGDCVPAPEWAQRLTDALAQGADVVAGKTRYAPASWLSHPLGLFDFGHIQNDRDGAANSFIANNVAFRTAVFREHRYDERVRRSGGEYLLASRLKARGLRLVYRPDLIATHEYDNVGLGFVVKRLRAGYDAINITRLAPLGLLVSRVWFDVRRFAGNRADLEIPLHQVPGYWLLSLFMRGVEMAAGFVTLARPAYFPARYGW
jgi:cellulose synthase/poly-beta-1,6-N-acetylglucosamine synthase-like glycosyltransferase